VPKILIVDDDPGVRHLCRMVLGNEGYEVLEAQDGPTGVSRARAEKPDLVLLDWMMPEVDGLDTLRMLKMGSSTKQIPVVMITALDGLTEITVATFSGADGYVTKPFEAQDLLTLVNRFTRLPPSPD